MDLDNINYIDKIPNNVDLGRDRILQRALEHWQPQYMGWWYDMGPAESHNLDVYLRTAIGVDPEGWAQFDFVKMPEYRWGVFLAPPTFTSAPRSASSPKAGRISIT